VPWSPVADETSVRSIAFDPGGGRLAAIVRVDWSDCSAIGVEVRLTMWDLGDGAVRMHRLVATQHPWTRRVLAFAGEAVEVTVGDGANARRRSFRPSAP
jgi:hypothetical protein